MSDHDESLEEKALFQFSSDFDDAVTSGYVKPLPVTVPVRTRSGVSEYGDGQVKSIRDRLFRLGYLTENNKADSIDEELTEAIKMFQDEAGCTTDGWVGVNTWDTLQELFTFETPTEITKWCTGGVLNPAFTRAVNLRLQVLGVEHHRTLTDPPEFGKLRKAFVLLGVPESQCHSLESLLDLLFDHETLLNFLIKLHSKLGLNEAVKKRELKLNRDSIHFLFNLIKVELWLEGFADVKPDGAKIAPWKRKKKSKDGRKYSDLFYTLQQFWDEHGVAKRFYHSNPDRVFLKRTIGILKKLQSEEEQRAEHGAALNEDEVVEKIQEHYPQEEIEKVWKKRRLTGRIFDGAKRLWKRIKNFFKKVGRWLKEKLQCMVTFIKQKAAVAGSYIKRVTALFTESVKLFTEKEQCNKAGSIAVKRDSDFDYTTFISPAVSSQEVTHFTQRQGNRILRFRAVGKIMGILIDVIKTVSMAVSNPIGWLLLVKRIIAFVKRLNPTDLRLIRSAIALPLP